MLKNDHNTDKIQEIDEKLKMVKDFREQKIHQLLFYLYGIEPAQLPSLSKREYYHLSKIIGDKFE